MREVYPVAGADAAGLREILPRGSLKLDETSDCWADLALLRDESVPAPTCERDHADGNWQSHLNIMTIPPDRPTPTLFSRLAGDSFCAKVLNLGGFRRADDATRAGVANRLRCLDPLGVRLMLRVPLARRKQLAGGECPDFRPNGKVLK